MTKNTLIGYQEASERWDIERLFTDLSAVKTQLLTTSKNLSPLEKQYLCLLLLRRSPEEIAKAMNSKKQTVHQSLSEKIYRYINKLLEQKLPERRIKRWQDVQTLVEQLGYQRKTQNNNSNAVHDSPISNGLDNLVPVGWIWLGAVNSTSPKPPVGSWLIPVGSMTPVTILPMEVPKINSIVAVNRPVNVRQDRPQAKSNYQLFPKVNTPPLGEGTRLVILEVDSYLDLSKNTPNARIWAKIAIYNPPPV